MMKYVTNQKERMYLSLEGQNTDQDISNQRQKRGLINIIDNVMYTLFGVCDDKCVKKTREAIQKTEETGTNILHIMKTQTTVVKTVVKKIANTINRTEELYKDVSNKEQQLHKRLLQIQNKTDDILDLLLADEVHNLYTILTNQYAYETSTLEQIITAARGGIIHPSLMTPQEIAEILRAAKQYFRNNLNIPVGTKPSEIGEFSKIAKMSVYYENDRLVFITKIPLIMDIEFTLFNVIPIPMYRMEKTIVGWYVTSLTYEYIAITKDRKKFTTYLDKQISDCTELNMYKICKLPQPIQEANSHQPCEVQLFKGADSIPNKCILKKFTLSENIYHRLNKKNTWIHVGHDVLTVGCDDLVEPFIQEMRNSGEISIIDTSCRIFTRDVVLNAIEEDSNRKYKDFVPIIKIKDLLDKIPEHIHNYTINEKWNNETDIQLTDLHSVSKSLDEVQQMIDNEIIREQTQKHQFIHSNLLYVTIGLAILSTILIIAMYILIKCRYISDRQITDISRKLVKYRTPIRRENNSAELFDEIPFTAPPSPR
uniref:Envelope fusion protein n=1 Tax=Melanaphis sacchari TaxID=742174 RepID=A0A2H8U1R0_9HEMI